MSSEVLSDALATLAAALSRYGLRAPDEARQAAAEAVAGQVASLGRATGAKRGTAREPYETWDGFALSQPGGLLSTADAPPSCTLAEAQARTGCFLDILDDRPDGGGMTVAVKDIFRFADHIPSAGLPAPPAGLALAPSPLIPRLEQAGARVVATTKLSAWCYLPIEFNERVTPPRHPADPGLLVGGSSSGAAAAVASGAVSVALGSDTGGSTRIPAALTGVYGFKPSRGAIDTRGAVPLGATQDTIGILARSATDLRAVFSTLSRLPAPSEVAAQPCRVGVPEGAFLRADDKTREARDILLGQLRHLGCRLAPCGRIDLDHMNAVAGLITGFEAAALHGPRMADHPEEYPDTIRARLMTGLAISDAAYDAAQRARAACLAQIGESAFGSCDFIVFPVVNRHMIRRPTGWPDLTGAQIGALSVELLSLNRWVNLLGLPCVSVPVDCGGGLPAAVQVVGQPGSDHRLLKLVADVAQRQR